MTGSATPPTVLITGAGRGIGRALAVDLARAGSRVALVARSGDQLAETAERVREAGGEAFPVPADLTDPAAISKITDRARDDLGAVDILVNNAGTVAPLGPTAELDASEWTRSVAVNLTAPVALTLALLPDMLARGYGRIVNVSSGVVARPDSMPRGNAYVTTKTALEAHTLTLAAELAGSGVTANIYRPGIVDTAMQGYIRTRDPAQIGEGLHRRFVGYLDHDVLITPEDSARALTRRLRALDNGRVWSSSDPLHTD